MSDTLRWKIPGETFEDGTKLTDWKKIESSPWHWQYDTHELAFDIYEHAGQYWKLYHSRWCAWAYAVRLETLRPMTKLPEPNSKRHMMSSPHWDVVGTASLGKRNFCTRKLLESDT